VGDGLLFQITPQMRVLVAIEPVDGRKDSLARLCQNKLAEDPFSGCVFVFRSRSGTAIRLLTYDGQGHGCCRSGCRKGVSSGGRKPAARANRWRHMKHLLLAGDVSRVRAAPMWAARQREDVRNSSLSLTFQEKPVHTSAQ
jgi:transposase